MFAAQRITSNASKVHYVVGALDQATIRTVGDLLGISASYEAIRTRLTEAFTTSNAAKYRELIRLGGLGDRRPSQLLRDMRGNLAPGIGEEALKEFWMQRLPSSVKVVLISLDASLDSIAARAVSSWTRPTLYTSTRSAEKPTRISPELLRRWRSRCRR